MPRFLIIAPLALLLALTLVACGNKGPLVRPVADEVEDVYVDDVAPDPEISADEATDDVPVDDADTPLDANDD